MSFPPWIYGVILNLCGSIFINGGTNCMKHGHNLRDKIIAKMQSEGPGALNSPQTSKKKSLTPSEIAALASAHKNNRSPTNPRASITTAHSSLTSGIEENSSSPSDEIDTELIGKPKVWYFGTVCFVLGSCMNFVSFSFAAQSLLAALGSFQFISNVVFGKLILGETVTRQTVLATMIIMAGNALVVFFSTHASTVYTADDLMGFYDTDFRVYVGFLLAILLLTRYIYTNIDNRVKLGEVIAHSGVILPLLYAIMSAIIGTQSVVQAKCLSILLRATLDGENQAGNWFSYFVIVMWLASTSFWLTRMNKALSMFDGLFIIPVLQVFWTFFAIVSGGIYFEEFNSFSVGQLFGFSFGVMVVFLGVYMLAPGSDGEELVASKRHKSGSNEGGSRDFDGGDSDSSEESEPPAPRARGYSYDPEGKAKTRMISVWATTNDSAMISLVDKQNEPMMDFQGSGESMRRASSSLINSSTRRLQDWQRKDRLSTGEMLRSKGSQGELLRTQSSSSSTDENDSGFLGGGGNGNGNGNFGSGGGSGERLRSPERALVTKLEEEGDLTIL